MSFENGNHAAAANGSHSVDGNSSSGDHDTYRILPQFHSQPKKLRVICAGAGSGGLLLAYKMQKFMSDFELICYEKNPEVGGTWYENRYPGCACDVPAHSYTYPFEGNPEWSQFYASATEILQYFKDFANKHDLYKYVHLSSRILSAIWDEDKGIYNVQIESKGLVSHDWCHVFINGGGYLNSWKWPKIQGLHDFGGQLVHSAAWDKDINWENKTVAVIGTGSSAIQIVPQVQKTAKSLITFMRSPTWISPPGSVKILQRFKENVPAEKNSDQPIGAQYRFTEEDKERFRKDPEYFRKFRSEMDSQINGSWQMFIQGSDFSKGARKHMAAEMERRLGPGHDDLKSQLIPSWAPGCRRLTPGDGYLEALVKPNVVRVHSNISEIVHDGLIDETGTLHKCDILVCATGFNIAFVPSFVVRGVNGVTMEDEFNPEPIVYLGLTMPKFPNLFTINGVRGNWAAGPVLPSHDVQCEYILKCMKRMQAEGIKAMEIKREPVDQLYQHIDEFHKNSVWGEDCKSWYKNNIVGGKLWIWGGSLLHYLKTIRDVRWEHYDLRYHNKNMWAFLGNGAVEAQALGLMDRLAPYVRNSDDEIWEL